MLANAMSSFTQPTLPSHQEWLEDLLDGLDTTVYATAPSDLFGGSDCNDQWFRGMLDDLSGSRYGSLPDGALQSPANSSPGMLNYLKTYTTIYNCINDTQNHLPMSPALNKNI
jgi:hypothetical protein